MDVNLTQGIVLFGVRTPLIAEYSETCLRLNRVIAAAVKVDERQHRLLHKCNLVELDDVTDDHRRSRFIAAAFLPTRRRELVACALENGFLVDSALIDPTSVIASTSKIGAGSYVNGMSIVASGSRFGEHVFINRACNIGHHVTIDDYASIGPGVTITSSVSIGEGAVVGAGATLLPGVKVGDGAIVSAATRVHADVPANHLAIGTAPELKPLAENNKILDYTDHE
jgi:carbonic anhydrase/acetyltransferase-like protein (isoleucine patch superfamily)